MPKVDASRDYYGDLELTPSADEATIKRQFRKLALRYHPDRNRGSEAEVNAKFQIIQSANEILSDASLKAQYDEARLRRGSGGRASGVRGNPWASAGAGYAPPPRRSAPPPRPAQPPPASTSRFRNFTAGVPPTARTAFGEGTKTAYQAWTNMRAGKTGRTQPVPPASAGPSAGPSASSSSRPAPSRSEPPPRTAPRTPGQRSRDEASFGTSRRTGYAPHSSAPGDEPPVSKANYSSTPRQTFQAFSPSPSASSSRSTSPEPSPTRRAQPRNPSQPRAQPFDTNWSRAKASQSDSPDFELSPTPDQAPPPPPRPTSTSTAPPSASSSTFQFHDMGSNLPEAFTFSAGGHPAPSPGRPRPYNTRRSPTKHARSSNSSSESPEAPPRPEPTPSRPNGSFSGPSQDSWTEKIKASSTFPPNTNTDGAPAARPIRTPRSPTKNSGRSSRPLQENSDSSSSAAAAPKTPRTIRTPRPKAAPRAPSTNSTVPMDIDDDSPPRARNVTVEPDSAYWASQRTPNPKPQPPPPGPSEDSASTFNMASMKSANPIAPEGRGLFSMDDLGSSVPFPSKPGDPIPPKNPAPVLDRSHLSMPPFPLAPNPPTFKNPLRMAEVWHEYTRLFRDYVQEWTAREHQLVAFLAKKMDNSRAAFALHGFTSQFVVEKHETLVYENAVINEYLLARKNHEIAWLQYHTSMETFKARQQQNNDDY